ncbi:MAG: PAS domain S-box protein [Rubrobacteraceae bacterium]
MREDPVYRALFDDGNDGMVIAREDGRILDANPRACAILGCDRLALFGGRVESLFLADQDSDKALEELHAGGRYRGPLALSTGNGRRLKTSVTMIRYREESTGEGRVAVMLRNPEREDARGFGTDREWFHSLMSHITDMVAVFQANSCLGYVSPSTEKVLGYKPEELVGSLAIDLVHPDDLEMLVQVFGRVWQEPGIHPPFSYRARHKDGSWRCLEASANNMLSDPEVEGVVLVARDVTERIAAEKEVRRLNEELEDRVRRRTAELKKSKEALGDALATVAVILDQAPAGIAQLDSKGRWTLVNERLCDLTGYNAAELLGASSLDITHPEDTERERECLERLVSGQLTTYSAERRCRRKNGSYFWASISISATRYDGPAEPSLIAVIEDINERKEAELLIKKLTPRELEVLELLAKNLSSAEISRHLYISESTVKFHVGRLVNKLGVGDRAQAAHLATKLDLGRERWVESA